MNWEDHYSTEDERALTRLLYKRVRLIHLLVKDREALKAMNSALMKENEALKAELSGMR